jgi:hypothetical protein
VLQTRGVPRSSSTEDPTVSLPAVTGDESGLDGQELTYKRAPLLARFAVTMALLGCLVGMGYAFTLNKSEEGPEDVVIEKLTPLPGSETVPAQTPIIVDLEYGYDVEITVDGRPLPIGEIDEREQLAEFVYTPGEGKLFPRFENGKHVVQIIYWPKLGDKERDSEFYQWTFGSV